MSTMSTRKTRRVFYERGIKDMDEANIDKLVHNPYKKRYKHRREFRPQKSSTRFRYNKHVEDDDKWIGDQMTSKPKSFCT